MASIATLVVDMVASTGKFESDMARTSKAQAARMRQMKKDAEESARAIGAVFAAVAAATTAVVLKSANAADGMQKLALKTGLSTEALSQYAHVAELSGTSVESFGKGINKMQRSIVDASNGLVTQQRAFDRLGISVKELSSLSPDKQFETIAAAISNLESATLRTATAQEIFGRAGADLLPVIANGAKGIQELREEADRFGLTISQDFADNAAQFNDNLERMGKLAAGAGNQFTAALLPSLVGIQEAFLEGAGGMDSFATAGKFVGEVAEYLTRAFITLWGILRTIAAALIGLAVAVQGAFEAILAPIKATVSGLAQAAKSLASGDFQAAADALSQISGKSAADFNQALANIKLGLQEVAGSTVYFTDAMKAAGKVGSATSKAVESTANSFGDMGDQTTKAADSLKKWTERSKAANRLMDEGIKFVEDLEKAQTDYNDRLQEFLDVGDPVGAMVRDFAKQVEFANQVLAKSPELAGQVQASLNAMSDALGKAAAGLQDVAEESDFMREAMLEGVRIITREFSDMWSDILSGGDSAFDGLIDGFRSAISAMVNQISTSGIAEQIENLFSGNGKFDSKSLIGSLIGTAGILGGSILGGGGANAGLGSGLGGLLGGALGAKFLAGLGSFAGPIGTAIGAVLGGLLGGLFDKDRPLVLEVSGFSKANESKSDTDGIVKSLFGETFIRSRRVDDAALSEFSKALEDFDNSIAAFLDDSQIGKISDTLKTWSSEIQGETLTVEQLLNSRFTAILGTFSDQIQAFVNQSTDLQERASRLQIGVGVEKLFADQPDLFSGRTVTQFLAVVDAFRDGTEDITQTFQRLVAILDIVVSATAALKEFSSSSLKADYEALVRLQNETPTTALSRMASELSDAIFLFSGAPEDLLRIAELTQSVREGEIQLLTQIDAIAKGLNSTLDKLRADVLGQVNGPKSSRDLFIDAAALVDQIKVAQTPEDIAALTSQFDAIIRQFSPEETARIGNELVSLIDQFQSAANSQLEIARANAIESAESLRQLVDVFATDIGDPLALIAASNEKVAEALGIIAGTTPSEGEVLPASYDTSFDASLQAQSQILSDGTQQMTNALSTGVADMSAQLAQAIQSGFSRANVNVRVVIDDRSLVTS
jgi:hypothetical protein